MSNVLKLTDEQQKLKRAYEGLGRSPNGRLVLEDIRRRWLEVGIVGRTSEETIANAARHDVAQTIINMVEKQIDG
jgi:hypothetical protein